MVLVYLGLMTCDKALLLLALFSGWACTPRQRENVGVAVPERVDTPTRPDSLRVVADSPKDPASASVDDSTTGLPPVASIRGPLEIKVVYPTPEDVVDAQDSSFMHGSLGDGDASLTVNGIPVKVWPNGAWLAWLPLPSDSLMQFTLEARTATDSARLVYFVRRAPRFIPPPTGVWIDSTSLAPQGRVWWPAREYLPVSVRAAEGATVRIRFSDGKVVTLAADRRPEEVPWGTRAFDRDTQHHRRPVRADRYAGVIRGRRFGEDPGPVIGDSLIPVEMVACSQSSLRRTIVCRERSRPLPAAKVLSAQIEAIAGSDTARVPWPLHLALLDTVPTIVELDDDTAGRGDTDGITVGRATPGATYNWFFPTGTRAEVSGRVGDNLRLRLSSTSEAWVPAADAHLLAEGTPAARATVGSTMVTPAPDRLVIRIPLSHRLPFHVRETERSIVLRLYGAAGDVNWMQYGATDALLRRISWAQETADEVTLTFELSQLVWGYRTRWDQNDLVLEVRRPPVIDREHPLQNLLVVVDPGHPPFGATGPTGLREADANLAVALELRTLLEEAGARPLMVRTSDSAVELWPRVRLADSVGADLLISIHNNALPDGVNPFLNNGTSVYYNHPRSVPLALAVQRALVRRLGVRDLGIGRGDLALVRPTWMPAILSEGLFMMVPEQEAALRSRIGQQLCARGVFEGIRRFLEERAETQ